MKSYFILFGRYNGSDNHSHHRLTGTTCVGVCYSTEPGSNGNVAVTINVSVEHNIPMDDTSQRLEIWVGPRQLQRAQNVLDSSLASLVTVSREFSRGIVSSSRLYQLGNCS